MSHRGESTAVYGGALPTPLRVAVTVAAALLFWPAVGGAEPALLGPGLEGEIGRLVFAGDDGPLTETWQPRGAKILPRHVLIQLESEAGRAAVVLVPDGSAQIRPAGAHIGRTRSFSIWLTEGADLPGARGAAEALHRRIEARDAGQFFEAAQAQAAAAESQAGERSQRGAQGAMAAGPIETGLRLVAGIGLLLLLCFLAWRTGRGGGLPAAELAPAGSLLLGALLLRLAVPPWAPLHANSHGIAELRGFAGAAGLSPFSSEAARYGAALPQLVGTLLAPLGVNGSAPLALSALFGALSVVALFWLVRLLFVDRPWVAAIAALGLLLHPAHVRLSLSESHGALAGLLLLTGLAAGLTGSDRTLPTVHRHAAAWLAGFALALACELRVLTLLVPISAGLALVLLKALGRDARTLAALRELCSPFFGPALFVTVVAIFHYGALAPVLHGSSDRPWPTVGVLVAMLWSGKNILFDAQLTSPVLLPLAAIGAVLPLYKGRFRLVVALLLPTLILLVPAFLICACRTDAIRYQAWTHVLLFPLPAVIGLGRASLQTLVALLLVAGSAIGLAEIGRTDFQEASYLIAIEQAPSAPTEIVVPPRRMAAGLVLSDFPDYMLDAWGRVTTEAERRQLDGDRCAIFVGPACWSFPRGRETGGRGVVIDGGRLRSECVELLGGVERAERALADLAPLAVPHREWEFHAIPAARPRVGYVPCSPSADQAPGDRRESQ